MPTDLKLVDDKLSVNWRGKWVPLYSNNKPLANSTLQTKYGAKFLKDLSIPTVKHQKPELVQLPFNQFKYDKDFENNRNEFFLDESSFNDPPKLSLEELKTPIGNYLKSYQMIIPSGIKDPILLFEEVKSTFEKTLESNLDSLESLKYSIGLELVFKKDSYGPDTFTDPPVRFYTKNEAVFNQDEINLDKQFLELGERIENFIQGGSGWKLSSLKTVWLDIAQYKPLKGSSYIPLPDVLKHKAIINVKNDDDNCLRYALRSALFPASKNSDKLFSYPKEDGLNFDGIEMPTPVSQISKVEHLNNLAINDYGWENNKVIIHWISNQPKRINTSSIQDDEKSHYVWIKNLNKLLNSKNNKQMFHCERCMIGFTRDDLLQSHLVECRGINEQAVSIQMPTLSNRIISLLIIRISLKHLG